MKKIIITFSILLALFSSCDRSCEGFNPDMRECKVGCIDPLALNYDPEASIGNNRCDYFNEPVSITFSVKDSSGGPLRVFAETKQIGSYIQQNLTLDSYNEVICGDSTQTLKFGRGLEVDENEPLEIFYRASDSLNNQFEGTISAFEGECHNIEIPRQSPGKVLFHVKDFSNVLITLKFTGLLNDPENDAYGYFSGSAPTSCDEHSTFELAVGTYRWEATENGFGDLDVYSGEFEITSGGCTIIALN